MRSLNNYTTDPIFNLILSVQVFHRYAADLVNNFITGDLIRHIDDILD